MKNCAGWLLVMLLTTMVSACGDARLPWTSPPPSTAEPSERENLAGAWRSQVRFNSGALATIKDLEFMYVFNAGGTMTESSNYDGSPPTPPAYGVWKKNGLRQFEARYVFYSMKAPASFDDISKGDGWSPSGYGVLIEKITLSDDGKSYQAAITLAAFDKSGKPIEGGGAGTGSGTRIAF